MHVLLGRTVENTGRLFRMLPAVFRELSGVVFRLFRVVVSQQSICQFVGHGRFYPKISTCANPLFLAPVLTNKQDPPEKTVGLREYAKEKSVDPM